MKDPLEAIREQIKDDFKTTMPAMATQRNAVTEALKRQEQAIADLALKVDQHMGTLIAEFTAMRAYMKQLDDRLSAVERKVS